MRQERLPSGATRRVQPLHAQEVEPSEYCSVWYSLSGLESDLNVHTWRMGLVMVCDCLVWFVREVPRLHWPVVAFTPECHTDSTGQREPGQVGELGITEG
jgi:hypothetical protein